MRPLQLLIIGAGPNGLAAYAYSKRRIMDFRIVGRPMGFWRQHMPKGMFLRSEADWHIDPLELCTLETYMRETKWPADQASPIPLELFCGYLGWFQERYDIRTNPILVRKLTWHDRVFEAQFETGEILRAFNVLVAVGLEWFANDSSEITAMLPAGTHSHTCTTVNFEYLRGRRCLIIGGRQSAFEWAALIHEAGATEIHVSHRHATPKFEESNWSWVREMMRDTVRHPGWFRRLTRAEQESIRQRFWAEGRLKLAPWLRPRINSEKIHIWPNTTLRRCKNLRNDQLEVSLDNGVTFNVDKVILATGYKVNVTRIPFLRSGNILPSLLTSEGYPALDDSFQSSVPGLFFCGPPASRDFGPFFDFLVGCPVAAKIIIDRIASP
jgi:thioredoxin reductase